MTNASTGRLIIISGPTRLMPPPGAEVIPVETAEEMLQAVKDELPVDVGIFAAAVSDWRTASQADQKIKKDGSGEVPSLELTENPDILATIAHAKKDRPGLVVGFAAETENVIENAQKKLKKKGCDWVVANDVSPDTGVMGGDENTVHLVTSNGVEDWPLMDKSDVAARLMERVCDELDEGVWT